MRAVFFDFVGTIITREGETVTHQNIVREILKRAGRDDLDVIAVWQDYERESSRLFRDLSGKRYVPIRRIDEEAMRRVGEKYGFEVDDGFWDVSLRMHAVHGRAFPDAVKTLKTLRSMGVHVGLITDSDNDYIETHLKALGIYDLFDSITTSEDAGFYKPHPRIFELAMERAHVSPGESIYVGDNPEKDCRGAENVGMLSVLLDPDGSKKELWENCRVVVSRLFDVVDLVRGLNGS
ncbi:MAG: TIGR02253 family HAD-type hydrolase [Thermococci archaeon]|nr:TIGR02253 family HAD-type hydrolase [Thermococci archaeon]